MDYSLSSALFMGWGGILETVITGILSYFGIIVLLRLSGKRTLSKWNSFDFVVTIAFGSILASALLSSGTALVQSLVAVAVLILLQFIITWTAVRSGAVQALIKSEPSLLLFKGEMIDSILKKQRVAEGEVLAAIRLSGHSSIGEVDAVILETDGSFSVIQKVDVENASAMKDVRDFKKHVAAFVRDPNSYSGSTAGHNSDN
ncbi:MAG: DUF421 domain-containing protein [Leptolyngbya foveolarum]|uniref:DUF421 domain-containing protein n=1 Tax=Leptolyngbya foveolarum TaxID=47253 RepID=A0A2W4TSH8_9CYAN|nr:MAG: DUF421 domain-containing protein [Leptolyngbya foveolarum]